MTRPVQQMEQRTQDQRTQEQSSMAWGARLFGALQQWQVWDFPLVLVLLFGVCWWLKKWSCEDVSSSENESSSSDIDQEELEEEEEEEQLRDRRRMKVKKIPMMIAIMGMVFEKRIQCPM